MQICGLVTHIFSLSEKLIYYNQNQPEQRHLLILIKTSKQTFLSFQTFFFYLFLNLLFHLVSFRNRNRCRIAETIQVEYSHFSIESTDLFTIFFKRLTMQEFFFWANKVIRSPGSTAVLFFWLNFNLCKRTRNLMPYWKERVQFHSVHYVIIRMLSQSIPR